MRARALLALCVGLVGCEAPTEVPAVEPAISTIDSAALVGSWRVLAHEPHVGFDETWTLLANGEAVFKRHFVEGDEPDQSCHWSLDGDVLTTECPHVTTKTPIVLLGDRIEMAPLVRESAVQEPGVVAKWSAQIEGRGDYVNEDDANRYVIIESVAVTLYSDFRLKTAGSRGGSDCWVITTGDYDCAIESDGELACRTSLERLERIALYYDEAELDDIRSYVLRVPFDESAGEPRFAGEFRMRHYWERM